MKVNLISFVVFTDGLFTFTPIDTNPVDITVELWYFNTSLPILFVYPVRVCDCSGNNTVCSYEAQNGTESSDTLFSVSVAYPSIALKMSLFKLSFA